MDDVRCKMEDAWHFPFFILKHVTFSSFAYYIYRKCSKFELCSKILTLEKVQIYLAFYSLNRIFAVDYEL